MIRMVLNYQQASIADLDQLTALRVTVLRAANNLDSTMDLSHIQETTRRYYEKAFQYNNHLAYIVYDDTTFVATGAVSFYDVLPTYHNPTGKNAYVMNMYTIPAYRNRGIAKELLEMLVSAAHARGITRISLDATTMGCPLYEHFGFIPMTDEMKLPD